MPTLIIDGKEHEVADRITLMPDAPDSIALSPVGWCGTTITAIDLPVAAWNCAAAALIRCRAPAGSRPAASEDSVAGRASDRQARISAGTMRPMVAFTLYSSRVASRRYAAANLPRSHRYSASFSACAARSPFIQFTRRIVAASGQHYHRKSNLIPAPQPAADARRAGRRGRGRRRGGRGNIRSTRGRR